MQPISPAGHLPPHTPVGREAQDHLAPAQAGGRQHLHHVRAAIGPVIPGVQPRMVAGGLVKAAQVVGHQHRLIHQLIQPRAVHAVQLRFAAAQRHGQIVRAARCRLACIQTLAQQRQQGIPVFHILRVALDARGGGAGVFPVNVHAHKAVVIHQPEDAVRQTLPPLRRGAGVGKAFRAPAAHAQHPIYMRMAAQVALHLTDLPPVAARGLAVFQQGKGIIQLIHHRGMLVPEGQPCLVKHIHHHAAMPPVSGRFRRCPLPPGRQEGRACNHHQQHSYQNPAQSARRTLVFCARLCLPHRAFTSEA